MEKKDMTNEPPEKVKKLYEAVIDLINENRDINTVTVADITGRAGIGKGTAYEYFSSKDEIIANALFYYVMEKVEDIQKISLSEHSFREKIMEIMDFIDHNFEKCRSFVLLLKVGMGSYEAPESLKNEYNKLQEQCSCNEMDKLTRQVIASGEKEGLVSEKNEFIHQMVMTSQMVAYAIYLIAKSQGKDVGLTDEEEKEYIYQSIVKLLK